MIKFFLKAEKYKDNKIRVRTFAEQDNGYVGLADELIRQAQPHAWTKFSDRLRDYGEDKAQAEARKNGEFRFKDGLRFAGLVSRDIVAAEKELAELREELKDSKTKAAAAEEARKVVVKEKKNEKPA